MATLRSSQHCFHQIKSMDRGPVNDETAKARLYGKKRPAADVEIHQLYSEVRARAEAPRRRRQGFGKWRRGETREKKGRQQRLASLTAD